MQFRMRTNRKHYEIAEVIVLSITIAVMHLKTSRDSCKSKVLARNHVMKKHMPTSFPR